jgi:hypothetical protein
MPTKTPFKVSRGDVIKTHDGNQWVAEGRGTYKLHYVDGALPWIAKVGDRIQYAEFTEKSGSGQQYEAQRVGNEVEYGMGRAMPLETVRRATRKPELGKGAVTRPLADPAVKRQFFMQLMIITCVAALLNGLVAFYCLRSGKVVLRQGFSKSDLTAGVMSQPFSLTGNGKATRFKLTAPLDNAWMSVEAAVVRGDGMAVHVAESSLEYYHGRSGGESWSEGSRSNSFLVKIPDRGRYTLFIRAVSAFGNASRANKAQHSLRLEIRDRALPGFRPTFAAGVCLALFVLTAVAFAKWKEEDEEE